MTRPRGRVSRMYVAGYGDGWERVYHIDYDYPGAGDEEYDRGRWDGWLAYKRNLADEYGACHPDDGCLCLDCAAGPYGVYG